MILRTRGGGLVTVGEERAFNASVFKQPDIPRPSLAGGPGSDVEGLPAVLAAGRLISETIAAMGQTVYRVSVDGSRMEARDAWQFKLLRRPSELVGPFEAIQFKVWCLLFHGASYELKTRSRGEIVELFPLDPSVVRTRRDGQRLLFDVQTKQGTETLTQRDVLYTRSLSTSDPLMPRSLIDVASGPLRKQLHAETYQRRFYENDATPGGLLTTDARLTREQREDLRESWQARHQGAGNAGKLAVLDSGAAYQSIGISPRDAQFVESARFNVAEVARIFNLWGGWLGDSEAQMASTLEQENARLLSVTLNPWIKRVLDAQIIDGDMFPAGTDLVPEFDTDGFVRADLQTRYAAWLVARQGGWMNVNDIRAEEGKPPVPGGDEYQVTPVGGAPNLQPGQAEDVEDTDEE